MTTQKFCVYERIADAAQSGKGVRLSWDECCDLFNCDQSFRETVLDRRQARQERQEAELERRKAL
jgi:hypothetical protein